MRTFNHAQQTFIDDILESVRLIPIDDIVYNLYENPVGWCPFHNDKTPGSFSVSKKYNRYHCFSCGANGDGIDYVQRVEQLNFIDAILKLSLQFSIAAPNQVNDFRLGKISMHRVKEPPKTIDRLLDYSLTNNIASTEILNNVFSLFSEGNSLLKNGKRLTKQHIEHLKKERKLSVRDIERVGFFSMPSRSNRFLRAFFLELKNRYGYDKEILNNVPGFYDLLDKEKKTSEKTFVGHRGIGIPIKDKEKRIVGIQIRRDQVTDKKMRYVWFSSSFADGEDREDLTNGTGSGSPIYVAYPKDLRNPNDLFITEGVFKAEAMTRHFKGISISVQGIQNWKGQLEKTIEYLEHETGEAIRRIHFVFDGDIAENVHVYKAVKSMYETLKEEFPNIGFMSYWWEEDYGKGIDDVLNERFGDEILHSVTASFIDAYDNMIEALETETGNDIAEIDKTWVRDAFEREVLDIFQRKR